MHLNNFTRAIAGIALLGALHGAAQAGVIINDNFDNGTLGTNPSGIGGGFNSVGQNGVTESGGNAVFAPSGSSTTVITSQTGFNAFQAGVTTRSEFLISSATINNSQYRTYVGLRIAANNSNHFIATSQGLYVSIFQHTADYLGNTHQGNLIAVDSLGSQTVLESWDWGFGNSSGVLDIMLDTTATSYSLSFNQAVTSATSTLNGTLTGMGALGANFEAGAHAQWGSNTLAIDRITVSTLEAPVPTPSAPALLALGLAVMGLGRRFNRK